MDKVYFCPNCKLPLNANKVEDEFWPVFTCPTCDLNVSMGSTEEFGEIAMFTKDWAKEEIKE